MKCSLIDWINHEMGPKKCVVSLQKDNMRKFGEGNGTVHDCVDNYKSLYELLNSEMYTQKKTL